MYKKFLIIVFNIIILTSCSNQLSSNEYDDISPDIAYRFDQLFLGKWKIVECLPADFPQPSYISGFYEDGSYRGVNAETILGVEIKFTLNYVEYSGRKHEYEPRTYSVPLLSEDERIGVNYAKTLGISGNYYSVVDFKLLDDDRIRALDEPNDVCISDLTYLYLKERDIIYASLNGDLTYKLERIAEG